MSKITKQDTNGVKPLLGIGELGYDNYPAGGDAGRVWVGTGTENIPLAKKTEVTAVDTKADTHIGRVDNPHSVTKAQVGLGNVDNTSDINKPISSATQTALSTKVDTSTNQTIGGVKTFSSNPIVPTPTTGTQAVNKLYVDDKYSGFKNYIINGNFNVWQRGTSFSGLTNGTYSSDRWVVYDSVGDINYNVSRNAGVFNAGYGATYSFNSGTGIRSVIQFIENVTKFKVGSKVTISFEAYTNSTPYTVGVAIQGVKGVWASATGEVTSNIALTNTKTKYSVTLQIPDWTSLGIDWAHLEATKLALKFNLGANTNGRDFILGNVQLEEGSVATPFENRPYGLELSLCQRYYWKTDNGGMALNPVNAEINMSVAIKFPVSMRVVPTETRANGNGSGKTKDFSWGYVTCPPFGWGYVNNYTADAEL